MKYSVGIDEAASMTQIVNGWSFIVFPDNSLNDFEKSAQDILDKSKLKSFHGKEFKRRKKQYYIDFMNLIKNHSEQHKGSFIGFVLNSEKWEEEYKEFYTNLVSTVYQGVGVEDANAIKIAQKLIGALMQLQYRMSSYKFLDDDSFLIQIDTDTIKNKFDSEERVINIQSDLKLLIPQSKVTDSFLLLQLYNNYKGKFFPKTPNCEQITPFHDEDSFIIQAADIFGNFALAYIFYSLGKRSKTLEQKVEIFNEVFGDDVKDIDFVNSISIIGEDLKLKQDGLATIAITNFDIQ
jgi:hypothetical protein